jgi:F-type H+-transporting ATPase subunit b
MSRQRIRRIVAVAAGLASMLAFVGVAWASPEAAADAHGAHGGGLGDINWFELKDDQGRPGMIYVIINFGVLLFILDRIMFRNLRAGHREKRDHIKLELERAGEATAKAEKLINEFEGRLAEIEQEEARIMDAAKKTAQAEGERILKDAEAEAEKIKAAAIASAQREAMNRQQRLEEEIIARAVDKAEASIRASFGAADQRRIVDAYATEVAGSDLKAS